MTHVTLAISRWYPDGTCNAQSWSIDEDMADWLAGQLGTPYVEKLLDEDQVRRVQALSHESATLMGGAS